MLGYFVLLPALFLVPCIAAATGSVSGTVVSSADSTPIASASITAHIVNPDSIAIPDTSDATGAYLIENIPPGNLIYVLTGWASGYKPFYFRFDDLGSGSHSFTIALEPESPPPPGRGDSTKVAGTVLGRLVPSEPLAPVGAATVTFNSSGTQRIATTDQNGYYHIMVPTGGCSISASASGYLPSGSNSVTVGSTGLSFGLVLQGKGSDVPDDSPGPRTFALLAPYPNPFNPATTLGFRIATESRVVIEVCDALGRHVGRAAEAVYPAGSHELRLDASHLASGMYFVRMVVTPAHGTQHFADSRQLMLLR